jgi:hypothetical protein
MFVHRGEQCGIVPVMGKSWRRWSFVCVVGQVNDYEGPVGYRKCNVITSRAIGDCRESFAVKRVAVVDFFGCFVGVGRLT